MDVKLNDKESVRVRSSSKDLFIDLRGELWGTVLTADIRTSFSYIEIRKKDRDIRVFLFENKTDIEDYDFCIFKDAEILFSCNDKIK